MFTPIMVGTFLQKNIIITWIYWYFFEASMEILKAWKNFLLFNLNYFSLPLLLKTLFSHWRRYRWSYGRGFNISRYLEVVISNLFSRSIGAVMRIFLICIGLVVEVFIILAGLIIFLGWIFLPVFLIVGLWLSIRIIS